jgi:hypothetical protein
MAATTIGIVYAAGSKAVRRIIAPDRDAQLLTPGWAGAGETLLITARPADFNVQKPDIAWAKAQVKAQTGVAPPDLTCAVIDKTNTVEAIIAADPALDAIPGKTVVACYSPQIAAGCTYDATSGCSPRLRSRSRPRPISSARLFRSKSFPPR